MNALLVMLGVGAAALTAVVAGELFSAGTPEEPPTAARAAGAVPLPAPAAAAVGRPGEVGTVLARPLFSHSRRPVEGATPAAVARGAAPPLPRMTAILIDGGRRAAIFVSPEGGKPVTLGEGGQLGAYTIERIEPRGVLVRGPDGRQTVRTSFDPNPPTPITPLGMPSLPSVGAPRFPGILLPGGGVPMPQGGAFPAQPGAGYGAAR